jgi:hypothetical protein
MYISLSMVQESITGPDDVLGPQVEGVETSPGDATEAFRSAHLPSRPQPQVMFRVSSIVPSPQGQEGRSEQGRGIDPVREQIDRVRATTLRPLLPTNEAI